MTVEPGVSAATPVAATDKHGAYQTCDSDPDSQFPSVYA